MSQNISSNLEKLSNREKQILALLLKGVLVKDISKELGLKSNTISTFKKNIYYKTGASSVIELYELVNSAMEK